MNLEVKAQIKTLDFIFLLGGHDLEMIEIGKILKAKGLTFHDRNLHWGAKLSVLPHSTWRLTIIMKTVTKNHS